LSSDIGAIMFSSLRRPSILRSNPTENQNWVDREIGLRNLSLLLTTEFR
jgi:hypothetical protein